MENAKKNIEENFFQAYHFPVINAQPPKLALHKKEGLILSYALKFPENVQ
jgi:hypothetical protein